MSTTALPVRQMLLTQSPTFTRTAIGLHWLIALLIAAAFPVGFYMHGLGLSPTKLRLFSYHKWIGVTVFLLAVLRLVWRLFHHPPPLPINMLRWERAAAKMMHWLLYLLILAVPISGWLMSSATGFQTVWFGVLPLPDLIGRDKELGRLLWAVHQSLDYTLLVLVGLHVAAALKHHFLVKDQILLRILPFRRSSKS